MTTQPLSSPPPRSVEDELHNAELCRLYSAHPLDTLFHLLRAAKLAEDEGRPPERIADIWSDIADHAYRNARVWRRKARTERWEELGRRLSGLRKDAPVLPELVFGIVLNWFCDISRRRNR